MCFRQMHRMDSHRFTQLTSQAILLVKLLREAQPNARLALAALSSLSAAARGSLLAAEVDALPEAEALVTAVEDVGGVAGEAVEEAAEARPGSVGEGVNYGDWV